MRTDPKPLPTLDELNKLFTLDREAGHLYFNPRPRSEFPNGPAFLQWNTKCAGQRADRQAPNGYMRVRVPVNGKSQIFGAHRIIWKMVNGRDPLPEVDHINRRPSDNRPVNLREATRQMNSANRSPRPYRSNGVWSGECVYPTRSGKFRAQVNRGGVCRYLGTFPTYESAKSAVISLNTQAEAQS